MLSPSAHHDHISTCQHEFLHGLFVCRITDMSKHKVSWRAKGYTGDAGIRTEKGFRVRVVRDGIGARRVVIDQCKIVSLSSDGFD